MLMQSSDSQCYAHSVCVYTHNLMRQEFLQHGVVGIVFPIVSRRNIEAPLRKVTCQVANATRFPKAWQLQGMSVHLLQKKKS